NVTHVDNKIDPVADAETVETELMLSDMESLERRVDAARKKAAGKDKEALAQLAVMEPALEALRAGRPARTATIPDDLRDVFLQLGLITAKPVLYVCNVSEADAATGNAWSNIVSAKARAENAVAIIVSAAIEAEVSSLPKEERAEFLETIGLQETGLARVIFAGYGLLDLVTFFTVGPKETRAWTIPRGAKAPQAAGVIHTDFEKGFIRAETIGYDDYIACNGETGAKEAGKMRLEGKEYAVRDGDVLHFRFAN
ncbi:MAG: redox-regulated ATPase YchF, partial [Alphaproteobacteria bacterium]